MRSVCPDSSVYMPPAADYALRTGPAPPLGRRDLIWLAALLLLAFVPRLLVALRLGPVCDDGYFYLAVADAYDRGDFTTALWYLNINVYPVLIAAFERLGADPLAAAKAWGVTVATITILPLFGWLRRLLDRRVALAACGLYAVHPEFIEISAEPIRDATFWLLSALSLYLLWRAAAERRIWLFVAAGLSIAFAAHTRSEGWLLMFPAIGWPIVRWHEAACERWRTLVGVAAGLAMIPFFIVVFNVTILAGHDRWELGKLEHFRLAYVWITGAERTETPPQVRSTPQPITLAKPPAAPPVVRPVRLETAAPVLVDRLKETPEPNRSSAAPVLNAALRALEPVPLLLMLVGAIVGRRLLLRREHLVLSAVCVAVMLGVWVRQATLGEINGRYFLVCYFPASGAAGLGVLWVLAKLEAASAWLAPRPRAAVAATAIAVAIGGAHVADAVAGEHPSRDRDRRIGQLLGEKLGRDRMLVVLPRACRVGYYAADRPPVVVLDDTPIEALLVRHGADVVILEHRYTPAERCADLATRLIHQGWRPVELSEVPGAERFVVLTAPTAPLASTTARRAAAADLQ